MIKFTPLLLCYLLFLPLESSANTELNALNKQLNEAVELIESRYGISVSYSEQQAMKISLVADKVSNNTASESTETKILNAVSTYGLGNSGGIEPPQS